MKSINLSTEETTKDSPIGYHVMNNALTGSVTVSLPPGGSLIVEKSRLDSKDSRLKLGAIFGDGQYSWNVLKMLWRMLMRSFSGESLIGDRLHNPTAKTLEAELQAPKGQHIVVVNLADLGTGKLIVNKGTVMATTPNVKVTANIRTGGFLGDASYRLLADGRSTDYIAQALTHDPNSGQDGIVILAGHGNLRAYELSADAENTKPSMTVKRGGILAVTDNVQLNIGWMGSLRSVFARGSSLLAGTASLNKESCETGRHGYVITQQAPSP